MQSPDNLNLPGPTKEMCSPKIHLY